MKGLTLYKNTNKISTKSIDTNAHSAHTQFCFLVLTTMNLSSTPICPVILRPDMLHKYIRKGRDAIFSHVLPKYIGWTRLTFDTTANIHQSINNLIMIYIFETRYVKKYGVGRGGGADQKKKLKKKKKKA